MNTKTTLKRAYSSDQDIQEPDSKRNYRFTIKDGDSTATVKFLIVSDTHDTALRATPKCDVMLHCGDFTESGSSESIEEAMKALSNVEAELKLVIAGNHEISLDKAYYLSEGGSEAEHHKSCAIVRSNTSIHFLEEGTHHFTLKSGAKFAIYASSWTPKYGSSAFQYPTNEDRFNGHETTPEWGKNVGTEMSIIPDGVEIVMTHGPPQYILDMTADGRSAGCEHLRRAIARVRPRLHCFGHVHRGYGAQRVGYDDKAEKGKGEDCLVPLPQEWVGKNQTKRKGYACLSPGTAETFRQNTKQTLMVNAAIMDEENEPTNVPWLVELDLSLNNTKSKDEGGRYDQEMCLDLSL